MGYAEAGKGKYYYLRLKENFFDSDEIKLLESGENGLEYSCFLLKLYCKSLKQEGRLTLNDLVPYDSEMLATVTRCSVDFVEKALNKLKRLGLIEVLDDGVIYMLDIQNFIGKSSDMADRRRGYRARIDEEKGAKGQISDKSRTNVTTNVGQVGNRDIDRDIDRNRDRMIDEKEAIIHHLNNLLGYSDHTERFLNHFEEDDWTKLVEQIDQSEWLQANINREQVPKSSFIEKILNGGYKTYTNQVREKTGAVNSQTSKYSGDDLNAMARRKYEEFKNRSRGEGNEGSV